MTIDELAIAVCSFFAGATFIGAIMTAVTFYVEKKNNKKQ